MILNRALNNELKRQAEPMGLEFTSSLKQISVNGAKRGCSGFVKNNKSGTCVYVNTESSVFAPLAGKTLVRFSYDEKDYSSTKIKNGYNQYVTGGKEDVAAFVLKLLQQTPAELKEGYHG